MAEDAVIDGTFVVNSKVTIVGADGAYITGGLDVQADGVKLQDLTVLDGAAINGSYAGIYIRSSDVTLENVTLTREGDPEEYRGVLTALNSEVNGLTIEGGQYAGWATGAYLNPGATGATISGATFRDNNVGVSVDEPTDLVLTGNTSWTTTWKGLV